MEEVALLEVARAREEALKYDAAGDYAQSAARLAQAASYVASRRACIARRPGRSAGPQRRRALQAPGGFSAMKRKEMHYDKSTRQQGRRK